MTTTLLQGDCRKLLPTLPAASVQCVVTSPPYYGLRDYGVPGQLGLEATPDEYVQALVGVFREVWRVLRDDGTVWLNLGDSYSMSTKGAGGAGKQHTNAGSVMQDRSWAIAPGLKPKDLIGIPWMVAFALRADGWYLRSDIIWAKPNPMPESVTDRPTKAHEYIFLLSKSERYYYDADAIAEPGQGASGKSWEERKTLGEEMRRGYSQNSAPGTARVGHDNTTRNRRTVWTVATQPYKQAHFATFPEKLIEPCILAGSAARACEVCGAPWERVREPTGHVNKREPAHVPGNTATKIDSTGWAPTSRTTGDWQPTCACPNEGAAHSVILDPFAGSGTTLRVAERFCRDGIGIDLGYADLQEQRTNGVQKMMVDLL